MHSFKTNSLKKKKKTKQGSLEAVTIKKLVNTNRVGLGRISGKYPIKLSGGVVRIKTLQGFHLEKQKKGKALESIPSF